MQELIAPKTVEFFNEDWESIGMRHDNAVEISNITGIDSALLTQFSGNANLRKTSDSFCITTRMFWASKRETVRE
jgi:hypothetical protein